MKKNVNKIKENVNSIKLNHSPNHVAIIMDGNGRWATSFNKPVIYGHLKGAKIVMETLKWAIELKIKHLSLYVFSIENWTRGKEEINGIFDLFLQNLRIQKNDLMLNKIKVHVVGFIDDLSKDLIDEIADVTKLTQNNTEINLYLIFNYGGQQEISFACNKIAKEIEDTKNLTNNFYKSDDFINKMQQNMLCPTMPAVDLLIRTGKRKRISNFLLWYIAYAEICFLDIFWPEFSRDIFQECIEFYHQQMRTFGSRKDICN